MTVSISGNNYVSEGTRKKYEDLIHETTETVHVLEKPVEKEAPIPEVQPIAEKDISSEAATKDKTPEMKVINDNEESEMTKTELDILRKLQENLEKILSNNLSFEDHESNNELHQSIIEGDMEAFKSIVQKEGFIHTDMINVRNSEGKSPLFLMVEYCRKDMFDLILELKYYEYVDLYSKDS